MRAPIVIEVKDNLGNVVPTALVTIQDRTTGALATLYSSETSPLPISNPGVSDSSGRYVVWADRGAYAATVSGSGITPWTVYPDTTPAADGGIDSGWVSDFVDAYGFHDANTTSAITSTSYVNASPADLIAGVVVPANALIGVVYFGQAISTTALGSVAFFVNGVQVVGSTSGTGLNVAFDGLATGTNGSTHDITTHNVGVITAANSPSGAGISLPTIPQSVMGPNAAGATSGQAWFFSTLGGTFDFGVKYKVAAGGSMTLTERHFVVQVYRF